MSLIADLLYPFRRPKPPAPRTATGFFTDTTLCIGCKACEVACKQWNQLPGDNDEVTGMSYDNTVEIAGLAKKHGFQTQPIAMKSTHHAKMTELLIGRDLSWLSATTQ